MIKIWKYQVPGACEGHLRQILKADMQYGKPVVWVMHDDTVEETHNLTFYTVGTGWELTDKDEEIVRNSLYIDTVKDEEGYIWHIFAVESKKEEEKESKSTDS
jgi:hypothetical protein